jgi:DNA-binding CsgD family transcriptional regulator
MKDLPLAIVGRGTALLGVNTAFAAALETDASDLCRADLLDFTHPADAAWARPLNTALFADLGSVGTLRDIRIDCYRLRGRGGRILPARVVIRRFPPPSDPKLPLYNVGVVLPDARDPDPADLERHFTVRPGATPGSVEAARSPVEPPEGHGFLVDVAIRPAASASLDGAAVANPHPALSPRELEVIALVGSGLRNAEIAQRLFITEEAIKKRLQSVFRKLGLRDRVSVALYAARRGLAATT